MPAYPYSIIRQFVGAFPTKLDYSHDCTSAVQVVWSTIVNQMYEDGGFQQVYQSWIDQRTNVICKDMQKLDGSIALRMTDLAGVFLVLGACMGLAILLVVLIPSSWEQKGQTPEALRRIIRSFRRKGAELGTELRESTSKHLGRTFGGTVAGERLPERGIQGGEKGGQQSLNLTALGFKRSAATDNNNNNNVANSNNVKKGNNEHSLVGVPGPLPHYEDDDNDDYYDDDEYDDEYEDEEDVRGAH